ncbi:MAG: class I SAM-dependent methyltransferase [Pseudomonadota bacterium]|nr:class I SAM-dependent methyltransferase [Pseudomonadota bacterium]
MADSNADQIEYWNGPNAEKWVRNQDRMDATLGAFSDHVMDAAGIVAGDRVLDIGCGCGGTTLDLARRAAPSGRAVGADISRPMLAVARGRAAGSGLDVTFVEADASEHDFGVAGFDLLFSRFGVMFFADPDAAFANLGRAIRPGGRLAMACWRPLSENPWMLQPVIVAKNFVELPPRPGPEAPGPFSFAAPDRVRRILTAGGFTDIALQPVDHPIRMGGSPEEAVTMAMEVGPLGSAVAGADAATRAGLLAALQDMLAGHAGPDGIALTGAIWCITARKE